MGEGKILVAIPMGMDFKELKKELENNRKEWFPQGGNQISIDSALLTFDEEDDDFYTFECMGIIDDEDTEK